MVMITQVHMNGAGTRHEHIASVRWRNPDTAKTGTSTVADMVDFIENQNGSAKVASEGRTVDVGVVDARPKYIRTHADGVWNDNLLALPRF